MRSRRSYTSRERSEPCWGKTPSFFALDPSGASLDAANQATDTIVSCRID